MDESKPHFLSRPLARPSPLGSRNPNSASAAGRHPLPPLSRGGGEPDSVPRAIPRSYAPSSLLASAFAGRSRMAGMQGRRIVSHGVRGLHGPTERAEATERVAPANPASDAGVGMRTTTGAMPDPKGFVSAMEVLNRLVEKEGKDTDSRAWVTRYAEDNASARFSREKLLPVWFLVFPDALLIIDMNGTEYHSNYAGPLDSWDVESNHEDKNNVESAPCRVVSSVLDAIRHGEVPLPQSSAEAAAMAISPSVEMHWGEPVGLLIKSPHVRMSILRDICQMYIPSFLQRAYPHGVPLKGHWTTASLEPNAPSVLRIPPCVQTSLLAALRECGAAHAHCFVGAGCRPGDPAPALQAAPPVLRARAASAPQLSSPWTSCGRQPLFTARLMASAGGGRERAGGGAGRRRESASPAGNNCLAVLVLTPRGPLELLAEDPGMEVTVRDLKSSLVRSGLGRSLRVLQSTVQFRYAPGLPLLDDNEVIDTRYAVLRLQMLR